MQLGVDPWQATGYLGMSFKILTDTYGHHHPDHLQDAATALSTRRRPAQKFVPSLVEEREKRERKALSA